MSVEYKILSSRAALSDIAIDRISAVLSDSLTGSAKVSLFLCGGTTPGPIYKALSERTLPWSDIEAAQVDERWVDETDAGSNAALIRKTLIQAKAASAAFTPMKSGAKTARLGQTDLEARYSALLKNPSHAVIGMGPDGHIGAWFPSADGLTRALDAKNPKAIQAILANRSDVTGPYLERITLTLSALLKCKTILLLITGAEKRAIFEKALNDAKSDLPIRALLNYAELDTGPNLLALQAD